jgi:aspartate/methionine/tyrosine aminotransferase
MSQTARVRSDSRGGRISDAIARLAESATLAVDAKAKAMKAAALFRSSFRPAGEARLRDSLLHRGGARSEACRDQRNHRYSPAGGLRSSRPPSWRKTRRDSGYVVEPSQVLVTNGGKQAVYEAFATLLDPGDEVLLPTPYWTTYPEAIRLAGGVPVEVVADESQDYLVSVEQLNDARTERTKVLLFCSPSNPTGAVYSAEQVEQIGRWASEYGLWVVTDEIYEHLTYDGAEAVSLPVAVPAIADRCIVLNGVAKTYAMTGWRVGWMIGPKDVVKAATTCSPMPRPTWRTSPSARPSPRSRPTCRRFG